MVYHEGLVYVVSTGTNEIYKVSVTEDGFGSPRLHWRYPNVEYDRDLVHLNGLTVTADGLVASCFGPRQSDGSWGDEGAVFRVDPYQLIQGGLSQPHTPLCCDDRLFFAESKGHRVYSLYRNQSGDWCADQPIEVDGYARGLVLIGNRLWVGISAQRRISRSKGIPNQGIASSTRGATITCIDLDTQTVIRRLALDGLGDEIYDLLTLDEVRPDGKILHALLQRIAGMQALVDTMRAEYGEKDMQFVEALQSLRADLQAEQSSTARLTQVLQVEQDSTATLAQALQAEQYFTMKLAQQLRVVGRSRLWQIAQCLRRMVGMSPYVPDFSRPSQVTQEPDEIPPALPRDHM